MISFSHQKVTYAWVIADNICQHIHGVIADNFCQHIHGLIAELSAITHAYVTFWWENDMDLCFVLDQHADLNF
jgi:hypothetical protein